MCDKQSFRPVHHNRLNYFTEENQQQYFKASKDQLDALQATVTDYIVAPEDQKPALLKQHGRIIQEIREQKA